VAINVIVLISYLSDTGYLEKIYCREVMMMMIMLMMIAYNIYFQVQRMQFVTQLSFELTAILGRIQHWLHCMSLVGSGFT
jgi:hypothetical protein